MTRMVGNVLIIEPEPDGVCEFCGVTEELRPYGPKGERVCFACAMKDKVAAEEKFLEMLNGPGGKHDA